MFEIQHMTQFGCVRQPRFPGIGILAAALLVASAVSARADEEPARDSATDKTLVAWVAPANLAQRGGSVLTIQSGDRFDAIVFGERARGKWMAGSEFFRRTQENQDENPAETAGPGELVQVAIVHAKDEVRIYRNGSLYASYRTNPMDLTSEAHAIVVFGLRHVGAGDGAYFAGSIDDARIYRQALTQDQLRALQPNQPSEILPLAWWDFEHGSAADRTGYFAHRATGGKAKVANGRLQLDGQGYLIAARTETELERVKVAAPLYRPDGPYVPDQPRWPAPAPGNWVTYHLAHPGPGIAVPGDPNCIFDHKGKVHLHYIYRNAWGFAFAHVSSDDMVHWRWHKTALSPATTGHGMFSGTGFYTKDGRPAIIYHGQGLGRNVIQYAADDAFESWTKPEQVVPRNPDGTEPQIRHWDPDCWIRDGVYYALSGGQNPQLMKSADLKNWSYLGDLLHPAYPANLGIRKDEDISCANMFPIGNEWMLLCISHPRGARYYLGGFKDEKFLPRMHAMLSFGGNQFFAPESVLTRDGRRVMWAWLLNMPIEPSGVQSLPRELELPRDGVLRIRPLRELANLRSDGNWREGLVVKEGTRLEVPEAEGDAFELEITVAGPVPPEFGVSLLGDARGQGGMNIIAGTGRNSLVVGTTEAPFTLEAGEELRLRIFVDKNLVEVFANDRQAAVFAVKSARPTPRVAFHAKAGDARVKALKTWRLRSIYRDDRAGE